MTSKKSLASRVAKARSAQQFVGTDGDAYIVPGTSGKQYKVTVTRNGVLRFRCQLVSDGTTCPGSTGNTICYHQIAVAEHLAGGKEKRISWCASEADARKRGNLGGKVYRAESVHGSAIWMVVEGEEQEYPDNSERDQALPAEPKTRGKQKLFKEEETVAQRAIGNFEQAAEERYCGPAGDLLMEFWKAMRDLEERAEEMI